MFRTGPQGFLLGFLVYLRSAQLVLPALVTEGEHLAKCGVQPLQDELHISGTSQALTGAVSTIKFFPSEAFLGRHFEAVELEGKEPEPGDLFLFRLLSPTGRWCGAHVGVYCGHGEIIHFEGMSPAKGLTRVCAPAKALYPNGQRLLLRSRSLWRVLRRRGGVDRAALERRVREAMDADPPPYHPARSNCVHFALHLLGHGPTLDPPTNRQQSY